MNAKNRESVGGTVIFEDTKNNYYLITNNKTYVLKDLDEEIKDGSHYEIDGEEFSPNNIEFADSGIYVENIVSDEEKENFESNNQTEKNMRINNSDIIQKFIMAMIGTTVAIIIYLSDAYNRIKNIT